MTKAPTHIAARRWFDRRYGNTYHAVTIYFDDGSNQNSGVQYGYGDQCLQTAIEMLGEPLDMAPSRIMREKLGVTYSVADVARKRDL